MTAPAMGSALPTGPSNPLVDVIVQAVEGHEAQAAEAVVAVGGRIGPALPIVNGFSAQLPAGAEGGLVRSDAIRAVTGNHRVNFEALSYDEATTASNFVRTTGAGTAWSQGFLGDGVGVAVIDTGISPINDLAGRIVNGPDLSGEGTLVDTYGHGTVMAGIIGGSGADASAAGASARSGVAPHATLVGVKVAGANGVTDVSNVLQAMHWVSAYKDQFNIRVLSLSWGTPSTADPAVDPLDYAVERLWRQGITVVVSAGNSGPQASITKPGDDPVVITAGAVDDKQNTDPADDSIPPWSSRGPTAQGLVKPDVVAPGRLIVAPRSFGSTIERQNPKALYPPSYIRGSGTSEAAAVTAGVVALLVQAHPDWSPDQIKAALKATASPLPLVPATSQGAGRVQLASALAALPGAVNWQTFAGSGLGNLESSRAGTGK
jgi:serine protease AprX